MYISPSVSLVTIILLFVSSLSLFVLKMHLMRAPPQSKTENPRKSPKEPPKAARMPETSYTTNSSSTSMWSFNDMKYTAADHWLGPNKAIRALRLTR